jgi:hypothetical protein
MNEAEWREFSMRVLFSGIFWRIWKICDDFYDKKSNWKKILQFFIDFIFKEFKNIESYDFLFQN